MWDGVKGFAEVQGATAFPSSPGGPQEQIRLVRYQLPFTSPCWLGLIPWLSCICCMMALEMICYVTFTGMRPGCPACTSMDFAPALLVEGCHICQFTT